MRIDKKSNRIKSNRNRIDRKSNQCRFDSQMTKNESNRIISRRIDVILKMFWLMSNLIDWWKNELLTAVCLYLDEKITSLYKNSLFTISFTDSSFHDSSRSLWESRSSVVTRLFSLDQAVFELCCHFDLISSESHIHLRAHWSLSDFENQ